MEEVEYRATAEAGSSMLVLTAWPLPVLGTPNPVITQNTQGLTGSLSQHRFPVCVGHVHAATVSLFPFQGQK